MSVVPYLNFEGRSDEAIAFYKGAVGAEVTWLMRFKEGAGRGLSGRGFSGSDS